MLLLQLLLQSNSISDNIIESQHKINFTIINSNNELILYANILGCFILFQELVDRVTYEVCVENAERHWQQVFYCFMVSILFIIPLIAMIFFYVRTSLELWRSAGRAKTMTSGSK